jgi:hypothetical protein
MPEVAMGFSDVVCCPVTTDFFFDGDNRIVVKP